MSRPTREQILSYSEDVLLNGLTKKESYQKNVDSEISQVGQAVIRMEKTQEYEDIQVMLMSDSELRLRARAREIRSDYMELIGKNISTMASVLSEVQTMEIEKKAVAVRLANETIGAMSIIDVPQPVTQRGSIDKTGAVQ